MTNLNARPSTLKQINLSLVRRAIREKGSATRAEIAADTRISTTTVRTLLTELLENKEIFEAGFDASAGGRKAVRYQLQKDRFRAVAICLYGERIRYCLTNICGEITQCGVLPVQGSINATLRVFLDSLFAEQEIRSIGLGVPGVVEGLTYKRKDDRGGLEIYPIGEWIRERYQVPVLLENALNAMALGFSRRCRSTGSTLENIAYIYFDPDCLSAGFLCCGSILRGWNNFVGELGLFPIGEHKTFDDLLASPMDDTAYACLIAKLIAGICCILNPELVALGGEAFRFGTLPQISSQFAGLLPPQMTPEIFCSLDQWEDYFEGMAHLTAGQIFAEMQLIDGSL